MTNITAQTTTYAVLGHPIGHSLSPAMHNAALRAMGLDGLYVAYDVEPEQLMDVLQAMQRMGFGGVNLTIPHKEVACAGLDELDSSAQAVGAVNTIEFTDGGMRGHNTDGEGLMRALKESFGETVDGRSVCVLGAGGTGRAIAITCATRGAVRVVIAGRREEQVRPVVEEVRSAAPDCDVDEAIGVNDTWVEASRRADLVVHTTSVGLKEGDAAVIGAEAFRSGQSLVDTIYTAAETPLMKCAREAGAQAINGLGMLLHQGAVALSIWTGREPPVDVMRAALEAATQPGS